jgi:hypothetical protein
VGNSFTELGFHRRGAQLLGQQLDVLLLDAPEG